MRLRARRRSLVIWASSASPYDGPGGYLRAPSTRGRRLRRVLRLSALLPVAALMHLARGGWPRGRLMLAGAVLTVAGVVMRGEPAGLVLVPGLLLMFAAPLIPVSQADRARILDLRVQLAAYSTPAQRRDLQATLDQYPDEDTSELRGILATQARAAYARRTTGALQRADCSHR